MSGLIFGNAKVVHHCKREAETGLDAVAVNTPGATEQNVIGAGLLVQSCIGACKSVCPEGCEMAQLAGLSKDQMEMMLRLSEI